MYNIGIVIKIKRKKAIILSENGMFEAISLRDGMFLGQSVFYNQQDVIQNNKTSFSYPYPVIISIVATFLLVFSYFNFFGKKAPVSYVDIDINPSVGFAVNDDGVVLWEQPLNPEATEIMMGITYENMFLRDAVLDLILKSKDCGYLRDDSPENIILISASFNEGGALFNKKHNALKDSINNLDEEFDNLNLSIDMRFVEVTGELRKEAVKNRLSMGKYMFYEEAFLKGNNISIEKIASSSLGALLRGNDFGLSKDSKTKSTSVPTAVPTPTLVPTTIPKLTSVPTAVPTPTLVPTTIPKLTSVPTAVPTPTLVPTVMPKPTSVPTAASAPTLVPTIMPKPTSVPTTAPTPTLTPTIAPTPTDMPLPTRVLEGEHKIEVQFYNNNEIFPTTSTFLRVRVENTGNAALNLEALKLRYYYTIDGYSKQEFICDWASIGAYNITGRFQSLDSSHPNVDTFLEIGFQDTAGNLMPGDNIEMSIRFSKTDWSEYIYDNDYSFNPTFYNFEYSDKITAYIYGVLKWGREP